MEQPLRSRRDYGYNDLEEELEKRKKESSDLRVAKELIEIIDIVSCAIK
jgi:hypothetical protein